MNEADFVALLVFTVPMCFSPGPNNLLCAAHGSQHGFRASIPMTLGMLVGWSSLGVAVGIGTVFIEENQDMFQALTWVGATYIAYLGWKVAISDSTQKESQETERIGFRTGLVLQVVNGKAWIHDLVLLGSFGTIFGSGFLPMVALVVLAIFLTVPAILCWTAFGTLLRRAFSTPESAVVLNRVMGASLLAVAIWLVAFH